MIGYFDLKNIINKLICNLQLLFFLGGGGVTLLSHFVFCNIFPVFVMILILHLKIFYFCYLCFI